jgi:hypothetical protein
MSLSIKFLQLAGTFNYRENQGERVHEGIVVMTGAKPASQEKTILFHYITTIHNFSLLQKSSHTNCPLIKKVSSTFNQILIKSLKTSGIVMKFLHLQV